MLFVRNVLFYDVEQIIIIFFMVVFKCDVVKLSIIRQVLIFCGEISVVCGNEFIFIGGNRFIVCFMNWYRLFLEIGFVL